MNYRAFLLRALALVVGSQALLSCNPATESDETLKASELELTRAPKIKREAVFVISADGHNMGGHCTATPGRDWEATCGDTKCVPGQEDTLGRIGPGGEVIDCCKCAGTAYFDAQIRGLIRALERLPVDDSVEVSVIADTLGSFTSTDPRTTNTTYEEGFWTGPRKLLENVRWNVTTRSESLAKIGAVTTADFVSSGRKVCGTRPELTPGNPACMPFGNLRAAAAEAALQFDHPDAVGQLCAVSTAPSGPGDSSAQEWGSNGLLTELHWKNDGDVIDEYAKRGIIDSVNLVAVPNINVWTVDTGMSLNGRDLLRVVGAPNAPGKLTVKLECKHPGAVFPTASLELGFAPPWGPLPANAVRAGSAKDIAKALRDAMDELQYRNPFCDSEVPEHCSDPLKRPPNAQQANEYIAAQTGKFWQFSIVNGQPLLGYVHLFECKTTIDDALPGVQVQTWHEDQLDWLFFGDWDPPAIENDPHWKSHQHLARTMYGMYDLGNAITRTRGRVILAAPSPLENATPAMVEESVADCLEPPAKLRAIEVNQVIQDWNNSVPLYAGKGTIVKVFLEGEAETDVPDLTLTVERQVCQGGNCAWEAVGAPRAPTRKPKKIPKDATVARDSEDNFYVFDGEKGAPFFTGPDFYRFKVKSETKPLVCEERDPEGADCMVRVQLKDSSAQDGLALTDLLIDLSVLNDSRGQPIVKILPIDLAALNEAHAQAEQMLPVPRLAWNPPRRFAWNVVVKPRDPLVLDPPLHPTTAQTAAIAAEKSAFADRLVRDMLNTLGWVREYECSLSEDHCAALGVMAGAIGLGEGPNGGLADMKRGVFVHLAPSERPFARIGNTYTHELLHTLGRRHIKYCDAQEPKGCELNFPLNHERQLDSQTVPMIGPAPLDDENKAAWGYYRSPFGRIHLNPNDTFDLMGYCRSTTDPWAPEKWMSTWLYSFLPAHVSAFVSGTVSPDSNIAKACRNMWALENTGPLCTDTGVYICPEKHFPPNANQTLNEVLVTAVGPIITASASAQVSTVLTGVILRLPAATNSPTHYVNLELLDQDGHLRATEPVLVTVRDGTDAQGEPSQPNRYVGLATLPMDPLVTQIVIRTAQGDEIGRAQASAPPTLTLSAPSVSSTSTGSVLNLSWQSADADGTTPTHVVEYSADGGDTWIVLGVGLTDKQLQFDTRYLEGSDNAFVRVRAGDGFSQVAAEAGPFVVPNNKPTVDIEAPHEVTPVSGDTPVRFAARAVDREDGPLDDSSVVWSSDLDGELGTGAFVRSASSLSPGLHTITATVVDADGVESTATTTLEIAQGTHSSTSIDLSLRARPRFAALNAGDEMEVEVEAENVGERPAASFGLSINLPDGFVWLGTQDPDWNCAAQPGGAAQCDWVGAPVAPSAAGVLRVRVRAPTRYDAKSYQLPILLRAEDHNPANDSDVVRLDVAAAPAPSYEVKVDETRQTPSSGELTFALDVAQEGAGDPRGTVLTLTLDQPFSQFVSAVGDGWLCGVSASDVRAMSCRFDGTADRSLAFLPRLDVRAHTDRPELGVVNLTYLAWQPQVSTPTVESGATTGNVAVTPLPVITQTGLDLALEAGGPCDLDASNATSYLSCSAAHFLRGDGLRVVYDESALLAGLGSWSTDIGVRNNGSMAVNGSVEVLMRAVPGIEMMNAQGLGVIRYAGDLGWVCTKSNPALEPDQIRCVYQAQQLEPGRYLPPLRFHYWLLANITPTVSPQVSLLFDDVDGANNVASHSFAVRGASAPNVAAKAQVSASLTLSSASVAAGASFTGRVSVRNSSSQNVNANDVQFSAFGAPALLELESAAGTGWQCTLRWGRVDCRYQAGGVLTPGQALPDVVASVRATDTGVGLVPVRAWNANLAPNELAVALETTGQRPLPSGRLAFVGCPPDSAACNPGQWPLADGRGPMGTRIIELNLPSTVLRQAPTLGTPYLLEWERSPSYSSAGVLLYRRDAIDDVTTNATFGKPRSSWRLLDGSGLAMPPVTGVDGFGAVNRFVEFNIASLTTDASSWALTDASAAFGPGGKLALQISGSLWLKNTTRTEGMFSVDAGVNVGTIANLRSLAWGPSGDLLAYASGAAGQERIWLASVLSSTLGVPRALSASGTRQETDPAFSPVDARLAFASQGDIFVIDLNTQVEIKLVDAPASEPCRAPAWSTDALQLAFQCGDGDDGIFVQALSGGPRRVIARGRTPAFRPDPVIPLQTGILPDQLQTSLQRAATIAVLANDTGTGLRVIGVTPPARGQAACTAEGLCTYTPGTQTSGSDRFVYTVRDALGAEGQGVVDVSILGVAAGISIAQPLGSTHRIDQPLDVSGRVSLDAAGEELRALYIVDLATDASGTEQGTFTKPAPWPARAAAPAVDLCSADPTTGNVVDCYVSTLNASLAAIDPAAKVGALTFGRDVAFAQVSPGFRFNVNVIDHDPAAGVQAFVAPFTDLNHDGFADVVRNIRNAHTTAQTSCTFSTCVNGYPVDRTIGYSTYYASQWRNVGSGPLTSLDPALATLNATFAAQPGPARNVAFMFLAGSRQLSLRPDGPLARAVAAGTTIHTFARKAQRLPINVTLEIAAGVGMGEEQPKIQAFASELANALVASGLDFLLCTESFSSLPDYFASTVLAGDPRLRRGGSCPNTNRMVHFIQIRETRNSTSPFFASSSTSSEPIPTAYGLHVGAPMTQPFALQVNANNAATALAGSKTATCPTVFAPNFTPRRASHFVSMCDDDWTFAVKDIVAFDSREKFGCDNPASPAAQIAARTGGTCTDLIWDRDELPMPRLPGVQPPYHGDVAAKVQRVQVWAGNQVPVQADVAADGQYHATLAGVPDGVTQLNARVVTVDGLEASATRSITGVGGTFRPALTASDDLLLVKKSFTDEGPIDGSLLPSSLLVLANDHAAAGATLQLVSHTQPRQGQVTCNTSGSCSYAPPASAAGLEPDSFTYRVSDGTDQQATAVVRLEVDPNRRPVAGSVALSTTPNTQLAFDLRSFVRDPDGNTLSFQTLASAAHGTLACAASGACTYVSPSTTNVVESLIFRASDGVASSTLNVQVSVVAGPRLVGGLVSSDPRPSQGGPVSIQVELGNLGSGAASAVELSVIASAGTQFTGFVGNHWSCALAGNFASCAYTAALAPGAQADSLTLTGVAGFEPALRLTLEQTNLVLALLELPLAPVQRSASLSMMQTQAPVACGADHHLLAAVNTGALAQTGSHLEGSVLGDARVDQVQGAGWSCSVTGAAYACVAQDSVAGGAAYAPVEVVLTRTGPAAATHQTVLLLDGETQPSTAPAQRTVEYTHGDADADGREDCFDNCVDLPNPDQRDSNSNGRGDACEVSSTDLAIALSLQSGPLFEAQAATYVASIVNLGTREAADVHVRIVQANGVRVDAVSGSGWLCGATAPFECIRELALAAGATDQLIIIATPLAATQAKLGVEVTSLSDDVSANDAASHSAPIVAAPDLSVSLLGAPAQVGDTSQVVLRVVNEGVGTTRSSSELRVAVPAGFENVSVQSGAWTCVPGATLICRHDAPLAPQASHELVLSGTLAEAAYPALSWTASVSTQADRSLANNSAALVVPISGLVDLAIAKSHSGSFAVGVDGSFRIVVSNVGRLRSVAPIEVIDELPASLELLAASGEDWQCSTTQGLPSCVYDRPLSVGTSTPALTVQVRTNALATGGITNVARVAQSQDGDPSNNVAQDFAEVLGQVDAALALTRSGPLEVGVPGTYTAQVTNLGERPLAAGFAVALQLAPGLNVDAINAAGFSCTQTGPTIRCTYSASLPVGQSANPVQVIVTPGAAAFGDVTVTASVSAAQDIDASNDSATDTTSVGAVDLALALTQQGPFTVGSVSSYRIALTNLGNRSATGPQHVVDTLPAGLTYQGFSGAGWSCGAASAVVRCDYSGSLAAGAAASVLQLDVKPLEAALGAIQNRAQIDWSGDRNPGNDSASIDATVTGRIDAALSLVRNGDPVVGSQTSYDVLVRNLGTIATHGTLLVKVTLPTGLTLVSTTLNGWTCGSSNPVQCSRSAAISAGGEAGLLTLTVAVGSQATSPVRVLASITADADAQSSNDVAEDSSAISPPEVPPTETRIALWPPNHKFTRVTLSQCVARFSNCPGPVTGRFLYGLSDEAADADGHKDATPDIVWSGCAAVDLRVERLGTRDGRVYRLAYDAVDNCGRRLVGVCGAEVPHDQGNCDAVFSGESYRVSAPACGN
jgi:uncharacterized repeat protein (TIGR01451 family)